MRHIQVCLYVTGMCICVCVSLWERGSCWRAHMSIQELSVQPSWDRHTESVWEEEGEWEILREGDRQEASAQIGEGKLQRHRSENRARKETMVGGEGGGTLGRKDSDPAGFVRGMEVVWWRKTRGGRSLLFI